MQLALPKTRAEPSVRLARAPSPRLQIHAENVEHFALQFKDGRRCEGVKKRVLEPLDPNKDYGKLRVGELKALLALRGVPCQLCVEKADFVRKARAGERAAEELRRRYGCVAGARAWVAP